MKKIKFIIIFSLCFLIVGYGFIKISSDLPDFIKNRSYIKVSFHPNPFDLKFDIGNYIIYINNDAFKNINDSSVGKIKNAVENSIFRDFIKGEIRNP
ncbi:hypothetical protein JK636_05360 [Clostridium sp. YIM B02515]|uniref:Uncharacterized protein n=1 Tax=Clostridium rhizosphaerae TaxID=2803861 RepID=A0ABS1T8S0_9CLOT|nr:hypothetical protein [Clostridium rhizosphaerae]MBL4935182.1 hypothetical protein [Clostridium rhizosphaerae]